MGRWSTAGRWGGILFAVSGLVFVIFFVFDLYDLYGVCFLAGKRLPVSAWALGSVAMCEKEMIGYVRYLLDVVLVTVAETGCSARWKLINVTVSIHSGTVEVAM